MNLVSIIVPCYNYGWLLAETLESVLAQTYPHWECLIVDDGSTDDTRTVAEVYQTRDARFRYVYRPNSGLSAARNTGIGHATGTYLQFLDADDLLAPLKLELQVNTLDADPEVDVLYGDVRYFEHEKPAAQSRSLDMQDVPWMTELTGMGAAVVRQLVERNQFVVNAPLIRKALLDRVGGFSEQLRSMEDWELWMRCALAGAYFQYDGRPDVWALVRVHAVSMSQNRSRMVLYERQVRQMLKEPLRAAGMEEAQAANQQLLCQMLHQSALHGVRYGKLTKGLAAYWQLAHETGKYIPYFREAVYWFRHRGPIPPVS